MANLRIRVGPSLDRMETCNPNDEYNPVKLISEHFEDNIKARVVYRDLKRRDRLAPGHLKIKLDEYQQWSSWEVWELAGSVEFGAADHVDFRSRLLMELLENCSIGTLNDAGYFLIRINNFQGVVPDGFSRIPTCKYFEGHRRLMSFQFQGRFKEAWTANDLVWSSDWDKPLNVPKMMSLFTKFWSMTDPGSYSDLKIETPYMRSYVATAMCTITSWAPQAPTLEDEPFRVNISENATSLLPSELAPPPPPPPGGSGASLTVPGPPSAGSSPSASTRSSVTGFEVFNPYFNPNNFTIKIPGVTIDMRKMTNGQPMRTQLMSKDGRTVFFIVEVSLEGEPVPSTEADIPPTPEVEALLAAADEEGNVAVLADNSESPLMAPLNALSLDGGSKPQTPPS
ncbi:hypothetical protein HDU76_010849 [Blyttiomyces sp. JEL0837]|nr:hypothetical protein HDU76_010849 [Blyttiomyces sp. JEL0837]